MSCDPTSREYLCSLCLEFTTRERSQRGWCADCERDDETEAHSADEIRAWVAESSERELFPSDAGMPCPAIPKPGRLPHEIGEPETDGRNGGPLAKAASGEWALVRGDDTHSRPTSAPPSRRAR